MEVPIQYFQSVIALELAVTGALLWQISFFRTRENEQTDELPDYRLRLLFAVVLGATLFGSLAAMVHGGDKRAATAVTVGLAVSLVPILVRILPPLGGSASTRDQSADFGIVILGLVLYVIVTGGTVFLLNT